MTESADCSLDVARHGENQIQASIIAEYTAIQHAVAGNRRAHVHTDQRERERVCVYDEYGQIASWHL